MCISYPDYWRDFSYYADINSNQVWAQQLETALSKIKFQCPIKLCVLLFCYYWGKAPKKRQVYRCEVVCQLTCKINRCLWFEIRGLQTIWTQFIRKKLWQCFVIPWQVSMSLVQTTKYTKLKTKVKYYLGNTTVVNNVLLRIHFLTCPQTCHCSLWLIPQIKHN